MGQILLWINTLTNDKDEVRLAKKLIKVYNEHTASSSQMTLANVGTEVKQFWRDIKETQDLTYNGTKTGGNNNPTGKGHGNKNKRYKKKDKKSCWHRARSSCDREGHILLQMWRGIPYG